MVVINKSYGRCPECGRKAYIAADGRTVCRACGHGCIQKKKPMFICPTCLRGIVYLKSDGSARCGIHGLISKEDIDKQRKPITEVKPA